jgi:hypothetical protein
VVARAVTGSAVTGSAVTVASLIASPRLCDEAARKRRFSFRCRSALRSKDAIAAADQVNRDDLSIGVLWDTKPLGTAVDHVVAIGELSDGVGRFRHALIPL